MDAIKLASTYFFGTEDYILSNSMIATVTFKRRIDTEKLFSSYRSLIMDNPLLQAKRVEQFEKDTFVWGRFSQEELEHFLEAEKVKLSQYFTEEEVLAQYSPTNARLPFRIYPINEYTMIFAMNHAVANGLSLVFWIKRWLEYYSGEPEAKSEKKAVDGATFRGRLLYMKKRVCAFLWMPVFAIGFMSRLMGKAASADGTVDLSYGRRPEKGGGYVKKSYCFSKEKTGDILRRCRSKKMTLTEYICYQTTQGLLNHAPGKRRVFISMPMDLQLLLNYSPETMHGNYVASLPMQFFRDGNLEKQVKSAFKWFKRGVPHALSLFFASFSSSYRKYKQQCLELCMKTMPERFPLWNFSITLSNLGIISDPIIEEWVDTIYFSIKNQSLLLTTSTLSGRLMMEVSVLENLYDSEEVFGLFDRILSVEHLLNGYTPVK
ncbi:hypothetical protein HPL003_20355 [Paenibacillus terrae HPL-003]|uniref:Condensation domain-containing protein n=1 Tax=Paenibacillus terrae (strain HPL-003) TaxID=985665 RepID=G7VS00_PAETH|nr:hypothetical protein [Paenibacillus terrae]AET60807.1 hypothetical protein HPL003_20355 [Paenibacillus terrae HPL-003]